MRYTAIEMREAILKLKSFQGDKMTLLSIEGMLRQAADDLGCNGGEDYEYAIKFTRPDGSHRYGSVHYATMTKARYGGILGFSDENVSVARRLVGRWEDANEYESKKGK